jgi:acyl carrier protein
MSDSSPNAAELTIWMVEKIASMLQVATESIDPDSEFVTYGLDSAASVELLAELELRLKRQLDTTLIWAYPTIRALASELADSPG